MHVTGCKKNWNKTDSIFKVLRNKEMNGRKAIERA